MRKITEVEVLWNGDPISCSKLFGEVSCKLCLKEKVEIFKYQCKHPDLLLNRGIGIFNDCNCRRHKRFHRLERKKASSVPHSFSTDEGTPERSSE